MPSTASGKVAYAAKCLELIISCVCIALYDNSFRLPNELLLPITFGGYIIIIGVPLITCLIIKCQKVPRELDMVFSFIGVFLFIASGALALQFYTDRYNINPQISEKGIAMGAMSILNGIIFIIDFIFTYKNVSEYIPQ